MATAKQFASLNGFSAKSIRCIKSRQLKLICEICHNLSKGNIFLDKKTKTKLLKYKQLIRKLANKQISLPRKKVLLGHSQFGGFFPLITALLPAIINGISSLVQ